MAVTGVGEEGVKETSSVFAGLLVLVIPRCHLRVSNCLATRRVIAGGGDLAQELVPGVVGHLASYLSLPLVHMSLPQKQA